MLVSLSFVPWYSPKTWAMRRRPGRQVLRMNQRNSTVCRLNFSGQPSVRSGLERPRYRHARTSTRQIRRTIPTSIQIRWSDRASRVSQDRESPPSMIQRSCSSNRTHHRQLFRHGPFDPARLPVDVIQMRERQPCLGRERDRKRTFARARLADDHHPFHRLRHI